MSLIAWSVSVTFGSSNPELKSYIHDVVGKMKHDVYNRVWKAITSMESDAEVAKYMF